jgi:hypothetical protein
VNAPTADRDATFKLNGRLDFNNPDNWVQGYVPTGVATIPRGIYSPLTFSQADTTFQTFNALGDAGFTIASGQSVTLKGVGVLTTLEVSPWFAVFGKLIGNMQLNGAEGSAAMLYGTGVITGNVENLGGYVTPGASHTGELGTLTIDGDYLQNPGGPRKTTVFRVSTKSLLAVTGRVLIASEHTSIEVVIATPAGTSFTALTAGKGLSGKFAFESSQGGPRPDVSYDTKNVYVTI